TRRRSRISMASEAPSPSRSASSRGWSSAGQGQAVARRVRAQARLLEDQGAERAQEGQGQGEGTPPASALLLPEALGHLGALRPAAGGRRRAGLLGHPEGAFARSAGQATRDADRGPSPRVPRVG